MAGANLLRTAWSDYEAGTAVAYNSQQKLASLGTGWFVTRIQGSISLTSNTEVLDLPANTTVTNWSAAVANPLGFGIQSGPTGYGGYPFILANSQGSEWWAYEVMSAEAIDYEHLDNPPYVGIYRRFRMTFDYRFGLKAQAQAQDFWLSYGWMYTSGLDPTFEFFSTGWCNFWYG